MTASNKTDRSTPLGRDAARGRAQALFSIHDERTALVKDMVAKENAASDQKTAKLRALRLAKEAADEKAHALLPDEPAKPAKTRTQRKIIRV
jgi:hypothetical protein